MEYIGSITNPKDITNKKYVDDNDTSLNNSISNVQTSLTTLSGRVDSLQAAVGSPLTATSAADMTDTSKVYVYVGTTTSSLTNGHWYYYDGSEWTDGGQYNSVALPGVPFYTDYATAIPANSDLNSYTTPGNYRVTGTNAATLTNAPESQGARLIVMTRVGSTTFNQIWISNASIYYRGYLNSAWTEDRKSTR